MKNFFAIAAGVVACGALLATTAHAQQPIVYPAKGQSSTQQKKDEGECGVWAKDNTGVDPAAIASAPPPNTEVHGGQRIGGAARGALGGAAIGAIAGDAGKGAAIGATTGVLAGGMRARREAAAVEANAQNVEGAHQAAMSTYFRAYDACLKGRGYSIE